jgi:hypothetical protein
MRIKRQQRRGHGERVRERNSPIKGESAQADLGKLGEELSVLTCLLRTRQVEEAVHLVVGDVRQQSLSGGACVERATGVGAGDECEAG